MSHDTQFGDVYPKDRYAPPTPFSNSYQCKDGEWIVLTILQYERYFQAFCEALEIPEYINDTRYNTLSSIKSNPEFISQFCHILEDAFAKKDSTYWGERLKAADIAFERATHYDEMEIGHTAYFSKTITEHDVGTFAGVTGDFNPAHMNQVGAENMRLPGRIAHGALSSGLISAALGTKMPGQGCLYLSQSTKFVHMVHFGDTLTVRLEVIEKMEKYRVKIKTEIFNQNDELVATGEAVLVVKH